MRTRKGRRLWVEGPDENDCLALGHRGDSLGAHQDDEFAANANKVRHRLHVDEPVLAHDLHERQWEAAAKAGGGGVSRTSIPFSTLLSWSVL